MLSHTVSHVTLLLLLPEPLRGFIGVSVEVGSGCFTSLSNRLIEAVDNTAFEVGPAPAGIRGVLRKTAVLALMIRQAAHDTGLDRVRPNRRREPAISLLECLHLDRRFISTFLRFSTVSCGAVCNNSVLLHSHTFRVGCCTVSCSEVQVTLS